MQGNYESISHAIAITIIFYNNLLFKGNNYM